MQITRTILIWVFGLLASAIIGGVMGSRLGSTYDAEHYPFWGVAERQHPRHAHHDV